MLSSSSRLGVEAPVFRPVAQIVTMPQITAPEAPASLPAHVAPEEMSRAAVTAPAVPWGEVYVDGRRIGVTPPLKRFETPLGRHLITIINSSLPIFQREVTVGSDANMTVAHDFSCASVRDKICREGFGKSLELPSRVRLETAEAARSQ